MTALITLLDMTAKRSGAAEFDRGHDAALRCAQLRVMLLTIGVAVFAEHVRHFRPRPFHQPRAAQKGAGVGWAASMVGYRTGQQLQGARRPAYTLLVAIRK